MCLFIAFAVLDQPETFDALLELLGAFNGTTLTGDDVTALGKQILETERDFNRRAGFTRAADRLPAFFSKEPLAPHNLTFQVSDEDLDAVMSW
jgi:aldehyde:ferredoxin oxidoreductase